MLWLLVVVAAALGAVYYRWSRRRLYRLAREIPPGMKEYPIVGHTYLSLFISNDEGTTDPDTIEVVSRACLAKDDLSMKFMRSLFGNGMAFAPVNMWHGRRKMMAPFFSVKNVNQLLTIVQNNSSIMSDLIQAELGGGDFSIWKYLTTFGLDNICEALVDIKMNSQPDPNHFVLRSINEALNMVSSRMLRPWLHPNFVYKKLVYKQFLHNKKRLSDFAEEVIRRNQNESAGESKERNINGNARFSFVNTIQQHSKLGKDETDLAIREELVACIFGNDTTTVSLCYSTVLLSRYPGVQDKVYQELKQVFGDSDSDRPVSPEDLPRLKYLEAVIKESLRLYPPFPAVVREVHSDVVLPSGKTLVDGVSVLLSIWGTHRNPKYWGADAELFRPERFLEGPLRHRAMFIPFSYSVRNCVGYPYAMMSMKTALANLLRRYKLLPPTNMAAEDLTKPLRVEFSVFMKAVDKFLVRIEERNKRI